MIQSGPLVDAESNVYLAAQDAVRKFSPDGRVLWSYPASARTKFGHAGSINGASLFMIDMDGWVAAIDLESGEKRWRRKVAETGCTDIGAVEAHSGVVLASAEQGPAGILGGCVGVVAVNASTGDVLWRFRPDNQLWNFMPMFTGNGSVVFQDQIGGLYHVTLADGQLIWRAGYRGSWASTWTDGGTVLGPNGVVYAVSAALPIDQLHPNVPGDIRAYRLADGELLWARNFTHPPNSWPVVGRLREGAGLSVVLPVGAQGGVPLAVHQFLFCPLKGVVGLRDGAALGLLVVLLRCCGKRRGFRDSCRWLCCFALLGWAIFWAQAVLEVLRTDIHFQAEVWAFDAETGAVQWRWDPPPWVRHDCKGDAELLLERLRNDVQPVCVPNPWASATLDANGTIYTGYMNGKVYAIRDANGDGRVEDDEVDEHDAGGAFSHPGVAMAPHFMAIASCDTMFVFKS